MYKTQARQRDKSWAWNRGREEPLGSGAKFKGTPQNPGMEINTSIHYALKK